MALLSNECEMTLQLDYSPDELSPAQKAAYDNAVKEHNEIRNKLKEIVKETGGKNIFSGEVFTAYQVLGPVPGLEQISQPITSMTKKKPPSLPPPLVLATTSRAVGSSAEPTTRRRGKRTDDEVEPVLTLEVDNEDEDYIPLSKRMKQRENKSTSNTTVVKKTLEEKAKTPELKVKSPVALAGISSNLRPTESSAIGGLQLGVGKDKKRVSTEPTVVVDLTKDDGSKPTADSREIIFNKIQGKTFPSLVVIARPYLRISDNISNDRFQLDTKVKNVLVHQPPKFTEWLIQQGLIKSDHTCKIHTDKELKLARYSDQSKFHYTGGYFWISSCCPLRFTSVFNGSLFEGSPHPPTVILKLIYHWACQTNVSNVVNWVKVDNVYLKGFYTLLRSVCTLAICRHMKLLGGAGKLVEIGVISLGTTTQDGQQRQVKVEVLGVLDQGAKLLRLRAVEPLTDGDRSFKKRFAKILEPLKDWVHKDSIILTDLTVDKGTLNSMGYKTVQQVASAEANGGNSNANIMDYLRRIVPRMFQNTLSLLSRQIIQQFLNELVWREMYGTTPCTTFDNIVIHLAEQAKIETKDNLITRLNKVSVDPFKHWKFEPDVPVSVKTPAKRGRKPKDYSATDRTLSNKGVPMASSSKAESQVIAAYSVPPKKNFIQKMQKEAEDSTSSKPLPKQAMQKKTTAKQQKQDENVMLETYYYGCIGGNELKESALACCDFEVWCPECPELTFHSNIDLLDHLLRHAKTPPTDDVENVVQCRCCLEYVADKEELKKHRNLVHPLESKQPSTKTCSCLICQRRLSTVQVLVAHMQKSHHALEMPYHCVGCDYRSSSLLATVDHFYENHKQTVLLQCPFCLHMGCAYRRHASLPDLSEPLMKNVQMFLDHLRAHTSEKYLKRCNKCVLRFLTPGSLMFHELFDHAVVNTIMDEVRTITTPMTKIPPPKKKVSFKKDWTTFRLIKPLDNLVLNMENGNICLECGNDFDEFNHMIGLVQCIKCPYQTTCLPSVVNHVAQCNPSTSSANHPVAKLKQEMHCNCGFSSFDGFALARHLAVCDRGGCVYPSVEAAQANVVKRSMLDMLGLIRRDDDEEGVEERNDGKNVGVKQTPQSQNLKDIKCGVLDEEDERISQGECLDDNRETAVVCEVGTSGIAYDPSQSLYNIASANGEQQFNTQLSLDDLGPPSVLPAQDTDRTPQLKDDYQSLATPRVPDQPDY